MNQVLTQVNETNAVRLYQSMHVGTMQAFGKWKLILLDTNNNVSMEDISEKTARALIDAGMSYEG